MHGLYIRNHFVVAVAGMFCWLSASVVSAQNVPNNSVGWFQLDQPLRQGLTSQGNRLAAAEATVTDLESQVAAAEAAVTALQTQVDALEAAPGGGPTGQIISAIVQIPSAVFSAVVFTTPATGDFLLTQFCALGGAGAVDLSGSSVGFIPVNIGAGQPACTTYSPGVPLPQNETLSCGKEVFAPTCMIIGVLSD